MTLAADAGFKVPPRGAVMPEHRALRALAARSDRRGLMQLAAHVGALLASGLLVAQAWGSLWLALAMPLHGILLTFLFAPLHETIHRTAFRRRWLNDTTAWLCGLALALPPEYFRAFHFAHHRHTQDPARCPLVADMLRNTRTTRSLAPVRRLAWNMPYHAEHHACPWLPFHALPAAHRLLEQKIAIQASGYVAVNRAIIRMLAPHAERAAAVMPDHRPWPGRTPTRR